MTTVAPTDQTVTRMDRDQYDTGQGPCLTAATEAIPILVGSLADEERWPAFVPLAREQGITSVVSTPLVVAGRSVGALNVYSSSRHFGPLQQETCVPFADPTALLTSTHPASTFSSGGPEDD